MRLLNFFSAESRERTRYDLSMKEYEKAAVQTGVSLALLNFGPSIFDNSRTDISDGVGCFRRHGW